MRFGISSVTVLAWLLVCGAPSHAGEDVRPVEKAMNRAAESYVRLVLAVGQHDSGYVDAYYGPEAWQAEAEAAALSLAQIRLEAASLLEGVAGTNVDGASAVLVLRHRYLVRQLESVLAYVDILGGARLTFDEESEALYDAVAPVHPEAFFREALARLDTLLTGSGNVSERLEAFRGAFVIPKEKLDDVFVAAITECRRRTRSFIDLAANERFEVEYVTEKPWSAYNWYQGDNHSLIQVNTDLPIYINRAIDLACHEGYPGHHVYNTLLEDCLVRGRGWMEYCVYPLFSPQSLIAEGSANFGIEVAFPEEERLVFERDVLFPLAGLDPAKARSYYEVEDAVHALGYAGNEAARSYLDGVSTREETVDWLIEFALLSRERAVQRVKFIDTYRSYVINYNLGQDLVRSYINSRGGTGDRPLQRWKEFADLISSPRLPSGLR